MRGLQVGRYKVRRSARARTRTSEFLLLLRYVTLWSGRRKKLIFKLKCTVDGTLKIIQFYGDDSSQCDDCIFHHSLSPRRHRSDYIRVKLLRNVLPEPLKNRFTDSTSAFIQCINSKRFARITSTLFLFRIVVVKNFEWIAVWCERCNIGWKMKLMCLLHFDFPSCFAECGFSPKFF